MVLVSLTFLLIVIPIIVIIIREKLDDDNKHARVIDEYAGGVIGALIIGIIMLVVCGTIMYSSYYTYITMKQTHGQVMNNYQEAIEIYGNKAVIDAESLTDFKYEGYQESLSTLIKDLRHKIITYNKYHIGKNELHNNILFSWLIVPPDTDMKLLSLNE